MTGQMDAKVRFVRCPTCRLVLQELPQISVYKCGGCGTILQAKHWKPDTKDTELHSAETGENGKKEAANSPEKKEISHLNQECTISSKGELSAGASPSQSDDNFRDSYIKQAGDKSLSAELPVSPVLSCHENEDLSPKHSEQMEQDERKGTLGQDTGEGENEFCDSYTEWLGGRSSSDDFPSSMELTYHGTEDLSPEPQAQTALDKVKSTSNECTRVDKIECGNCERGHENSNFLSKVPLMTEDKHEESYSSPKGGGHGEDESLHLPEQETSSNECTILENVDCCREISSVEVNCYEPEIPLAVVEPQVEVDKELNGHVRESLKAEDTLENIETDSIDAAESPSSEGILSDNVISPDNQHLELSQRIIPQDSERASSVDSFDSPLVTNSISELGLKHTDFPKSFTASSYYAYDSSVSSYDGIEDQKPGRFLKPPRRKFKHLALVNPNRFHKQDESRVKDYLSSKAEMHIKGILETGVDDILTSESEARLQARKCLILQGKNHRAMKYTKQNQYDLPDPRSFGHSGGSRMRADQEEYAPQLPFLPRYSFAGRRNEISSSYQYNGLQHHSGFCSSDTPSYAEPDKMELLRMVYELIDELNRTHVSNSRFPARFSREKNHSPLFYDHLAPAEEMYADLHHSRYRGRCSRVQGFETNSDDMRQLSEMKRLHVRERYRSTRQHLRPVAGGMPIVACFHCSELLQLPADFLLFGRRCHQLRCSACRKIMKFSLQSGGHLAPCITDAIAPPSMVDDCWDSVDRSDLISASHSDKCPRAEPLFCSDYYGLSFDRSCSTEWEPSQNLLPNSPLKSNIQNRKISSDSSFEPLEDRKMKCVLEDSRLTQKNSKENFGSAEPSTKASKSGMSTSEIEEHPPTSGSPLHWLMGYSSPSEVIKP